jgi:hypothetical protein
MVNESILSKDFWDFIFKILASVGSLASGCLREYTHPEKLL